jgi:KUP system potassium uptake protein
VPAVNAILFVAVVLIVLGFKTSNNLASAYGIAVTGTFVLNSILFLAVARLRWHVRMRWIVLGGAVILPVEVLFFAANTVKIVSGGWLPLVIALIVVTLLKTWASGRRIVTRNRDNAEGLLADFIERLSAERQEIQVVPGVAVFLTPNLRTTPLALQANVRYNRVLHDHVLIVRVVTERVPHVPPGERMTAEPRVLFSGATGDPVGELAERISLFTLHFGYRDEPDVPAAILEGARRGLIPGDPDMSTATYFLSQITIMPIRAPGLSRWRKALFVTIARNAANPATYFRLPDSRTVISSGRIAL